MNNYKWVESHATIEVVNFPFRLEDARLLAMMNAKILYPDFPAERFEVLPSSWERLKAWIRDWV